MSEWKRCIFCNQYINTNRTSYAVVLTDGCQFKHVHDKPCLDFLLASERKVTLVRRVYHPK